MLWVLKRDGSFEYPKHMLKIQVRKYLQFYADNFCLSKPVPGNATITGHIPTHSTKKKRDTEHRQPPDSKKQLK